MSHPLRSHTDFLIFHHPDWLNLIEKCYALQSNHINASRNGDGLMPLFFVDSPLFGNKLTTQPFNFYGGLVANSDDAINELLAKAREIRKEKRARYLEVKNVRPLPKEVIDEFKLVQRSPVVRYVVPLGKDVDEFDRQLKRRFREKLSGLRRSANNSGLIIEDVGATDEKSLRSFYNILTDEYRTKHFMLPQPYKLFRMAAEILRDKFHFYIARLNDRIVGGAIIFRFNKVDYYLWGAYDQKFESLSPLTLILAEAMKFGRDAGSTSLDLGVTSRSHEGLNFFKSRWGGVCEPLNYYYFADKPEDVPHLDYFNSFRTVRRMIRFAPRPVVQQTSRLLIRWLA